MPSKSLKQSEGTNSRALFNPWSPVRWKKTTKAASLVLLLLAASLGATKMLKQEPLKPVPHPVALASVDDTWNSFESR
jgi:hypothetical protein